MRGVDLTRSILIARFGGVTFVPPLAYKPRRAEAVLLNSLESGAARSEALAIAVTRARYDFEPGAG